MDAVADIAEGVAFGYILNKVASGDAVYEEGKFLPDIAVRNRGEDIAATVGLFTFIHFVGIVLWPIILGFLAITLGVMVGPIIVGSVHFVPAGVARVSAIAFGSGFMIYIWGRYIAWRLLRAVFRQVPEIRNVDGYGGLLGSNQPTPQDEPRVPSMIRPGTFMPDSPPSSDADWREARAKLDEAQARWKWNNDAEPLRIAYEGLSPYVFFETHMGLDISAVDWAEVAEIQQFFAVAHYYDANTCDTVARRLADSVKGRIVGLPSGLIPVYILIALDLALMDYPDPPRIDTNPFRGHLPRSDTDPSHFRGHYKHYGGTSATSTTKMAVKQTPDILHPRANLKGPHR